MAAGNKPTMLDIARRAGVSQAAVSYVLNGQAQAKRISPETEQAILDLAREMNYVPHAGARALRMQKTNILCLVNNLIHLNPLAMQMTSSRSLPAICLEAGHHGYRLLIETTLSVERGSNAEADGYRAFIHSSLSDGVILSGPAHDDARLKLLRDSGFATVTIGRSEIDEIDSVDSDNRQVAHDATAHLIEQGCRRIALLLGDTDYIYHTDRLQGYRRALTEAGLAVDDSLVQILPESWRDDDGDHLVSQAVDRLWSTMPPDGLFAGVDDMLASAALRTLRQRNVRPPRQVRLIGVNNSILSRELRPALTSIDLNLEELGRAATRLLIRRIEEPDAHARHLTIAHTLIPRESTVG